MPNTLDNSIPIENVATLSDPLPIIHGDIFPYRKVQELSHTPSGQTTYNCITMVMLAPYRHMINKLSNL